MAEHCHCGCCEGVDQLPLTRHNPPGESAVAYRAGNHATFKASLFMAAGIIDHETGTRDIRRLSGLWRFMPITAALAMVAAAESALAHWKIAGTWLEEERAEYRLARSQLQAGNSAAAVDRAHRCIEICEGNDAPAFERFFAHAVAALAQRAAGAAAAFDASRNRALALFEQMPQEDRNACEADLRELRG